MPARVMTTTPPASARRCGPAIAAPHGRSRCNSTNAPKGSRLRCNTVAACQHRVKRGSEKNWRDFRVPPCAGVTRRWERWARRAPKGYSELQGQPRLDAPHARHHAVIGSVHRSQVAHEAVAANQDSRQPRCGLGRRFHSTALCIPLLWPDTSTTPVE